MKDKLLVRLELMLSFSSVKSAYLYRLLYQQSSKNHWYCKRLNHTYKSIFYFVFLSVGTMFIATNNPFFFLSIFKMKHCQLLFLINFGEYFFLPFNFTCLFFLSQLTLVAISTTARKKDKLGLSLDFFVLCFCFYTLIVLLAFLFHTCHDELLSIIIINNDW